MIVLSNVTKRFGAKVAVDGLTLEIPQGEFFAFLGPNGAGKTTTMKMVAGLLKPTSGRIVVCGHSIENEYLKAKAQMAYIPDEPFIYDKLTGVEFLQFVGRMYRVPEADLRRDMDHWIDRFDMRAYIDELTETYSHGMKQRVAIAAALLHRPKLIVVDEPLVGLDPITSRLVKDAFREQARSGVTIFMSTHLLSIAEEVADRIGIIQSGRLIWNGTPSEMKRRFANLEEAFFRIVGANGRDTDAVGDQERGTEKPS